MDCCLKNAGKEVPLAGGLTNTGGWLSPKEMTLKSTHIHNCVAFKFRNIHAHSRHRKIRGISRNNSTINRKIPTQHCLNGSQRQIKYPLCLRRIGNKISDAHISWIRIVTCKRWYLQFVRASRVWGGTLMFLQDSSKHTLLHNGVENQIRKYKGLLASTQMMCIPGANAERVECKVESGMWPLTTGTPSMYQNNSSLLPILVNHVRSWWHRATYYIRAHQCPQTSWKYRFDY